MRSKNNYALFIIAITIFCSFQSATAQEVVSSNSGSYSSEAASVDFTIGEVLVESYNTNVTTYSQGFHQSYVIEMPLHAEEPKRGIKVIVYPNPASDFLKVEIAEKNKFSYRLHDLMGKLVRSGSLDAISTMLDISNLSDGAFRLSISDKNNAPVNSFLVIKKK